MVRIKDILKLNRVTIFLLIFFCIHIKLNAQHFFNNNLKHCIQTKLIKANDWINVLVKGNIDSLKAQNDISLKINYFSGDIANVNSNIYTLRQLVEKKIITFVEYNFISKSSFKSLEKSSISEKQDQIIELNKLKKSSAIDKDIIVGIIDTGIDITNNSFKDENGSTRIKYLWDQNDSTPNNNMLYGKEWTYKEINQGICKHRDLTYTNHGTMMAGIIAGKDYQNPHTEGIATESEIIFVALNTSKSSFCIADAVYYILSTANKLGKSCVINLSIGLKKGSHDPFDLESQLIENLLKANKKSIMITASGNSGKDKTHLDINIKPQKAAFVGLEKLEDYNFFNFYESSNLNNNLNYNLIIRSKFDPKIIIKSRLFNQNNGTNEFWTDTVKFEKKTIAIIKVLSYKNSFNIIDMQLELEAKDNANFNYYLCFKGFGKANSWHEAFSTGKTTLSETFNQIFPNNLSSISSGIQCSKEVITVGSCVNLTNEKTPAKIINHPKVNTGKRLDYSSIGPTRNNIKKPDFLITGENIAVIKPNNIATDKEIYLTEGTSASAALAAGWTVNYMQQNKDKSIEEIKKAVLKYFRGY